MRAAGVGVLACAVLLTGLLAAGSASARTTNADGSETLWEATLTAKELHRIGLKSRYHRLTGTQAPCPVIERQHTRSPRGLTRTLRALALVLAASAALLGNHGTAQPKPRSHTDGA